MSVQLPHNEQSLGMPTLWLQSLSAEPAIKSEGTVAIANGDGWDPLSLGVPSVVVYLGGTWAALGGGGAAVWGGITGTLGDQTDLDSALDAAAAPAGSDGQLQYNNAGVKGGVAGSSWAGNQLQLTAQAIGVAPLAIQRASGHTGNLLEFKSDLGAVLHAFNADGEFPLAGLTQSGAAAGQVAAWNGSNWAPATPATTSPAGNTNELQRNNAGAFGGATGVTWASNQLLITAQAAATVPLAVKATASHSAALTTWTNSAGTVLAEIRSSGKFVAPQAGYGFAAAGYGTNTGGMDYSGGIVRFLDGQNVVMVALQPGFAHQRGIFCNYKLKLANYTVATLPSAVDTAATGCLIFVTDESGGAVPAFSDGTDWRRVTDRAIVS